MPPEHRAWMEAAVTMLREQRQGEPLAEPVSIDINYLWPLPKTRPAWCDKERWALRKENGGIWHFTKPDIDNTEKNVLDALVAAGILEDDRFVVEVIHRKRAVPDAARIDVWITPV